MRSEMIACAGSRIRTDHETIVIVYPQGNHAECPSCGRHVRIVNAPALSGPKIIASRLATHYVYATDVATDFADIDHEQRTWTNRGRP